MPSRFITEPEDMDNASFLLTLIRLSGASKDRPIIDRCYLSKKLEAFSRSDLLLTVTNLRQITTSLLSSCPTRFHLYQLDHLFHLLKVWNPPKLFIPEGIGEGISPTNCNYAVCTTL